MFSIITINDCCSLNGRFIHVHLLRDVRVFFSCCCWPFATAACWHRTESRTKTIVQLQGSGAHSQAGSRFSLELHSSYWNLNYIGRTSQAITARHSSAGLSCPSPPGPGMVVELHLSTETLFKSAFLTTVRHWLSVSSYLTHVDVTASYHRQHLSYIRCTESGFSCFTDISNRPITTLRHAVRCKRDVNCSDTSNATRDASVTDVWHGQSLTQYVKPVIHNTGNLFDVIITTDDVRLASHASVEPIFFSDRCAAMCWLVSAGGR